MVRSGLVPLFPIRCTSRFFSRIFALHLLHRAVICLPNGLPMTRAERSEGTAERRFVGLLYAVFSGFFSLQLQQIPKIPVLKPKVWSSPLHLSIADRLCKVGFQRCNTERCHS